jgi:hypothetical protein
MKSIYPWLAAILVALAAYFVILNTVRAQSKGPTHFSQVEQTSNAQTFEYCRGDDLV